MRVVAGLEDALERLFPKSKVVLEHVDIGEKLKEFGLSVFVPPEAWPPILAVCISFSAPFNASGASGRCESSREKSKP